MYTLHIYKEDAHSDYFAFVDDSGDVLYRIEVIEEGYRVYVPEDDVIIETDEYGLAAWLYDDVMDNLGIEQESIFRLIEAVFFDIDSFKSSLTYHVRKSIDVWASFNA